MWDVELTGSGKNRILRVMIEGREAQVSIDDCEKVSKGLNLLLDVNDVVPGGSYFLEVSSPGIERHLTKLWQYEKVKGAHVDMVLSEPIVVPKGDPLRLRGQLLEVNGEEIIVEDSSGTRLATGFSNVKRARTVFVDKKPNKRA